VELGHEIIAAGKNEPRWTWTATQMVPSWNVGHVFASQRWGLVRGVVASTPHAALMDR